jgi:hypothetical protein
MQGEMHGKAAYKLFSGKVELDGVRAETDAGVHADFRNSPNSACRRLKSCYAAPDQAGFTCEISAARHQRQALSLNTAE